MEHRLRYMVSSDSPEITDAELDELETKLPFDKYMDNDEYEYSGNFIITKTWWDRDDAVYNMCCGIVTKDVELANGQTIYFAFDYGH